MSSKLKESNKKGKGSLVAAASKNDENPPDKVGQEATTSNGSNQFPFSQLEKLLTCPICLDRYKQPKLLPCQHTYCLECLENMADYYRRIVKCAECRTENILPYKGVETFPNNLTILSFLELPSVIAVEEMKNGNNNLLLLQQKNNHQNNDLQNQQRFLNQGSNPQLASTQQTQQQYRFIKLESCPICGENAELTRCLHCERKLCTECKDSHTEQLQREVLRLLTNTQKNVPKLEETIQVIEQKLANMKNNFNFVKNEIKMEIERCIRELNNRERVLLEEVDNLMESEIRKMTERQGTLSGEKEEIDSYCQLVANRLNPNATYENSTAIKPQRSPTLNVLGSDRSVSTSPETNDDEEGPRQSNVGTSLNLLEDSDETQDHLNQEPLSQAVASIDVNSDEDRPITEEELIGLKQQIGTYLEHIRDINVEAVESYKRMKFIADNNMLRSNILTFGELHVRSVVHSGSKSEGPSASGASLGYRTSSQDNDDNDILEENTSTRRGVGGMSPSEKSGAVQRNVNSRFLASSRNRYEPSPSNDIASTPSRRSTQASSSTNHENIFSGYLGNEVTPGPTASHSNKSWRTESMNRPIQQSGKFNELDSNRFNYGSKTNLKNKKISTDPPFGRNLMRSKTTLNLEYMDGNKYQNCDTRYKLDDDEIAYKYGKSSNNRIYKAPLKKYDLCESNLPISENKTNKSICYQNQKDNSLSNTNLSTPSNIPNLQIIENLVIKNRMSNLEKTVKPVGSKVLKKLEQDANNIEEIKLGFQNCSNGKSDTIQNDLRIDAQGDHWWKAWLIDEGEIKTRAEKKVEELKANKNTTDSKEETISSSKINKVVRGDAKNNITKRLPSFSRMMPASSVEHLQNPPIKLRMEQKRRQTKMDLLSDRSQLTSNERRVTLSKAMIQIPEYLNFENSKPYNFETAKKQIEVTSFETDYQGENDFCCNISHPDIHNSSEVNKSDSMLIINEKMGKDKETDRKMAESIRNKFNTLQRFKRRNEFLLNLASLSVQSAEESNATPNYVPIRERIQNLKNSNVVQPISLERNEEKATFANFKNQSSISNDPYESFGKSRINQDKKNSDNNNNPKSKNNFDKSLLKVSADKSDDFDNNLKKCLNNGASQNEQLLLEQIFDTEFKTYINEIQNLNLNISNNSSNEIFPDANNVEDRYDTPNGSTLGELEYINNHNIDNILNEAIESDNKYEDVITNLSSSDKEDNGIEKEALNQAHPKYKRSHSILIKHEPKSYELSGLCSDNENFENCNKTSDIKSKVGLIYTYQKDYNQDTKTSSKILNRKKSTNDGVSASLQIRVNPTPYKIKKNEMLNAITPDEVVTQHPMGMALLKRDSHYSLVVAEKEAHRIAFLDLSPSWTQGSRKLKEDISHYYGTFGYSHEKLNQPCDVTVGLGGQIAIADWGNNKVTCLDHDYSFERIIGTGEKGHLKGQFNGPTGLTFDTMGFIYVCDKGNRRVQVFSGDGIYVGKWGANHLVEPKRIYHSQEKSIIYVSDVGDHSVKLFDRNGIKIRTVSGIQKEFTASTYNVAVNFGSSRDIWRPEKFEYPSSLTTYFSNGAISENIVLLDSGNWRAVILSPDGRVIETYTLLDDSTINSKNPGRLDSCLSLPPNIGLTNDDEIPKFIVSNKLNNKLFII